MTYDPNTNYFQPSFGSLTGFDSVETVINQDYPKLGWSVEQLRSLLLNENEMYFPSKEWVMQVEQALKDHITNFNNPHNLTLDQITTNFIEDILASSSKGTIPNIPPFYSFDANTELPIGDIFPATYSNSNLYRLGNSGKLTIASSESLKPYSDYRNTQGGIPLFSSVTPLIDDTWFSNTNTPINTLLIENDSLTGEYAVGNTYDVVETDNQSIFGITIPFTQSPGVGYSCSFIVQPYAIKGILRIYQPSDPTKYAVVSLTNGVYYTTSSDVTCETFVYASGAIGISFGCTALSPTPDNKINVIYSNEGDTSFVRIGQYGRRMFSISRPSASTAGLNQPIHVDPTTVATTTNFTLDSSKISMPSTMSNVMIGLNLMVYPLLASAPLVDTNVFTFGALTITRDRTTFYLKLSGTTIATTPIRNGINTLVVSYSPTAIIFKDRIAPRQTFAGTYSPLNTTGITVNRFGGYLLSHVMYASSDSDHAVEFLANG
jgi:hypothetical protein